MVQVALLNNKGLQASYVNVGLSAAEAWQQATPQNPVVSIGVLGIGARELGVYRSIEGLIRANFLDATTRKQRMALADVGYRQAQQAAVNDRLGLATETRMAWINAVAASETVSILRQAKATSDAGSELALRLGETGALNLVGQAREQAFNAELAERGQTDANDAAKWTRTTGARVHEATRDRSCRHGARRSDPGRLGPADA